jgi:hypothetical protein
VKGFVYTFESIKKGRLIMSNELVILAALAKYKGVDLNHPNVEDMREIQREARENGEELEFDAIRETMEAAAKQAQEGYERRRNAQ